MTSFLTIFNLFVTLIVYVIVAQAILSWLVVFNVINLHQPFVRQVFDGLNRLTEPLYRPIRNILPNTGGIDLSPIIVLFLLWSVQTVLNNNLAPSAF
ncbi:MAG: YggT family protein [Pseudomonadota bacterium]